MPSGRAVRWWTMLHIQSTTGPMSRCKMSMMWWRRLHSSISQMPHPPRPPAPPVHFVTAASAWIFLIMQSLTYHNNPHHKLSIIVIEQPTSSVVKLS